MADDGRRRLAQEVLLTSFFGSNEGIRDQWLLDRVVQHMEELTITEGEVLFEKGDPSDHLWFIIDGEVRMKDEGHPDWVYRGDWLVGTVDLLAARTRGRSAHVEKTAHAFRIPSRVWASLFTDSHRLSWAGVVQTAARAVATYAELAPHGGFIAELERRARFDVDAETLVDRTILLHQAPLFRRGGAQALVDLARLGSIARFQPGERLFAPGAPARAAFVLIDGEVAVSREAPRVEGRFGPGQVVGGAIALGDAEGAWTATAVQPTSALAIAHADWFDAMEEHPSLTRGAVVDIALERERLLDLRAGDASELILD